MRFQTALHRFSGAEIVNVCKEASLTAVKNAISDGSSEVKITEEHLRMASAELHPRISEDAIKFYENFARSINVN